MIRALLHRSLRSSIATVCSNEFSACIVAAASNAERQGVLVNPLVPFTKLDGQEFCHNGQVALLLTNS